MAHILILGGGFGGLMTAEQLVKIFGAQKGKNRITLVAPKDVFTFYPALVRLAFGDCTADEITFDLHEKLSELNVRFVQGEVIKLNTNLKRVQVAAENLAAELRGAMPTKFYYHDIAAIIDEGGEDSIFLHYGVWDKTLYGLKMGKMWSRMKNESNQLWGAVRDG